MVCSMHVKHERYKALLVTIPHTTGFLRIESSTGIQMFFCPMLATNEFINIFLLLFNFAESLCLFSTECTIGMVEGDLK